MIERLFDPALKDYDKLISTDRSFLSVDGAMTNALLGSEATGANPRDRPQRREHKKAAGRCGRDSAIGRHGRRKHA